MTFPTGLSRSKPIPTKKAHPCPLCSDTSGKCRFFEDKPLILCMGAEHVPGWRNLGSDRSGLWQQFVPDTGRGFENTEWQQRKRAVVALPQTMTLDQRDRFYRDWLAKGSLNERDRADLQRRGVTDFSISISSEFGYAIPFQGLEGKYVGAQWRSARAQEGGRYRWHNLPGGKQFPGTNEMPIAVYQVDTPKGIALIEGTGIKPMIASHRLEMVAIGAAGGTHIASLTQLKAVLEAFPDLPIFIVPDAGDILNSHVMRRHDRTVAELRQLGVEPQFLWWNQRSKDQNDIDELTEKENIKPLTAEQFFNLNARDYKIEKRVSRFLEFQKDLQRDFLLPLIVNGDEIRWTPYQGYAPEFDLFSDTTFLQGWLGAGKTETILRSLVPFQDQAIVWLAPRNGLLRQTAQRAKRFGFNVYHYQDNPSQYRAMLEAGELGIYFMAADSFKPYAVGEVQWSKTILVVDEFSGIRKEVLRKTAELPQFLNALTRCASLILADAFLSQIDIKVLQKHRSGSIQILRQEFKQSPVRIKWVECRNRAGEISFSHEGIYHSLLDGWIEKDYRIAIAVDDLGKAKLLDRYLKSKGLKTQLVCSETPEQNAKFMIDPDRMLEHDGIQVVIYTPTAQSGLDIQAKFDCGLVIATGTLSPLQMLQMLGRCRQCPRWYISAPRQSGNPGCITPSLDGKKIEQWVGQIAQLSNDYGLNALPSIQTWALWEELTRNIEKAFNSEYLRYLLEYFFASVETVEVENDRLSEWRKDAQFLKNQEIENILKANLHNGLSLINEQKQPRLNAEVWDLKLAQFWLKYPKIVNLVTSELELSELEGQRSKIEIEKLGGCDAIRSQLAHLETESDKIENAIERLTESVDVARRILEEEPSLENARSLDLLRDQLSECCVDRASNQTKCEQLTQLLLKAEGQTGQGAINLAKLFHSRRVEKLRNYVMATEPNEQDDRDLLQYLRDRPTHYNASNFKRLQNIKLFRVLALDQLARAHSLKDLKANVNAFWVGSPKIAQLYREFLMARELARLFPLVDSQKSFFDALKACLAYLGYEQRGKTIRIETDELNPNGKDRHGKQRFSKSKSIYLVCWLMIEASGSNYFHENLELILQAIRDRLTAEREERAKRQEDKAKLATPPPGWEAQAA